MEGRRERAPKALLRSQREVDALYDALCHLQACLQALRIPFVLIAGSLLGAVRSASFLFSDDDIDIAVFAEDYHRMSELSRMLSPAATYSRRPFPAADRVRPRNCTQVWIDIFVFARYDNPDALRAVLCRKANGALQAAEAVEAVLAPICAAGQWPLWHYDNRLALELWPREFLTGAELFPLRTRAFGHLSLPAPAHALAYLKRAYGIRCFEEWVLAVQHGAFHKESAARLAAAGQALGTSAECGAVGAWPRPMEAMQYHPILHSRHSAAAGAAANPRSTAAAQLSALQAEQAAEAQWDGAPAVDPQAWPASYFHCDSSSSNSGSGGGGGAASTRLGVALAAATAGAPGAFVFTPDLLAVLEPHVAKARAARAAARRDCSALPPPLAAEASGVYSPRRFPLADALACALGVGSGGSVSGSGAGGKTAGECLPRLHELVGPGGKHAATARLRDAGLRKAFAELFDEFVGAVALPHLGAALGLGQGHPTTGNQPAGAPAAAQALAAARVQAFPCLRIIQPGEFSIGVHCDAAYGHAPGNVNFVVPLTGSQGCAGLVVESAPGREDWHGVGGGGEGTFARFHGGQCLHFAGENHTESTRVSLDFRVLWGRREDDAQRDDDDKYQVAGYYCLWECMGGGEGGGAGQWVRVQPLCNPDERCGYPFVGIRQKPGN